MQHLLSSKRAVACGAPRTKVEGAASLAVEVVVKQPGHTRRRQAGSGSIVALLDVVDGVAVAAGHVVARGREGVHEVEEADVAVSAGGVRAASGDGVVALVLGGAQVRDLLALVVGLQGFGAAGDEGGGILLVVGSVVGESLGVVVVGGAEGRALLSQT
jgi:hypothetical protein